MVSSKQLFGLLLALTSTSTAIAVDALDDLLPTLGGGRPQISLWQALHDHQQKANRHWQDNAQVPFSLKGRPPKSDPSDGSPNEPPAHPHYPARCFYQPLDHFDPQNNVTFCQRYWVSGEHYKPEDIGPVFVLDGGETSGANRLPFLEKGEFESGVTLREGGRRLIYLPYLPRSTAFIVTSLNARYVRQAF